MLQLKRNTIKNTYLNKSPVDYDITTIVNHVTVKAFNDSDMRK